MSNRIIRVNELVQREVSAYLHQRYQSEAVTITIADVRISPDLLEGRVFVSIVGDTPTVEAKLRWLRSKAGEIRTELGRRIVLKYLPKLDYVLDETAARGARILQVMDEIDRGAAPRREA